MSHFGKNLYNPPSSSKDRSRGRFHNNNNYHEGHQNFSDPPKPIEEIESREFLRECRQNCIVRLDRPPYYQCELCRTKLHVLIVEQHIYETSKHKAKFNMFKEDLATLNLPDPCSSQITAINNLLAKHSRRLLNRQQIALRMKVVNDLEKTINKWCPQVTTSLNVYGSTISGFGLDTSDINVELVLDNTQSCEPPEILEEVAEKMESRPETYFNIQKEVDDTLPRFSFQLSSYIYETSLPPINLAVSVNSEQFCPFNIAQILAKYASFDTRAPELAACLKIWANACGFDKASRGFWPSHVFPIMVIHFLQSCSPPILPSLYPADIYLIPSMAEIEERYQELKRVWFSENNKSLGELWLELLAFYAKDFKSDSFVINIRGLTIPLSKKEWSTCLLAIEDPLQIKRNLSRSIGRKELYFNFHRNLIKTYFYFMSPQTSQGSLLSLNDFVMRLTTESPRYNVNIEESDEEDKERASDEEESFDKLKGPTKMRKSEPNFSYNINLGKKFGIISSLRSDFTPYWQDLDPEDFFYILEVNRLQFFKEPPKHCIKCKRFDHYKDECQLDEPIAKVSVPDSLSYEKSMRLDNICRKMYDNNKLDDSYNALHDLVLKLLTEIVRRSYENANLQLFGSSKNGFGAKNCDLDLCMTFDDNETGKDVNQTEIIEKLAKDFRNYRKNISNLLPIPQAKVPVLRFRYKLDGRSEKFDCDITLYNLLAIYNTKLLRTYCLIDERVAILGLAIKHFFKECGICDASKGSLSSYAYTLMTLFYLQRCSPPVIPCLQKLYDGEEPPQRIIDGFNTWFFDDLSRLNEKWKKTNTSNVGDLFYGFFRFYAEDFNDFYFKKHVVCIRQLEELKKTQKKWTGKPIAIEDPFLLTHNLGQGIEQEMARYIRESIISGRKRIGLQPDELAYKYDSWEKYFFDSRELTSGPLPKGRGCHNCGSIGHQKSQCPEQSKSKNYKKKNQRRDDLDEINTFISRSPPKPQYINRGQKAEVAQAPLIGPNQSPPRHRNKSLLGNVQRQAKRVAQNRQSANSGNPYHQYQDGNNDFLHSINSPRYFKNDKHLNSPSSAFQPPIPQMRYHPPNFNRNAVPMNQNRPVIFAENDVRRNRNRPSNQPPPNTFNSPLDGHPFYNTNIQDRLPPNREFIRRR